MALTAGYPAAQPPPLASRIVPTDATRYRPLTAVHAGAGNMAFAGLLNRGAIGPHFNFLHRGEIPAGSGIGHHFHNTVEEMFVILNGEGQFTVNGRTARLQGPAAVVCRMGDSHALLNTGSETLQWMNFQASVTPGVGDAFDLGDDRVGAAVDPVPTFINARLDRSLIRPAGGRGRGGAPPPAQAPAGVMSRRLFAPAVFRSAVGLCGSCAGRAGRQHPGDGARVGWRGVLRARGQRHGQGRRRDGAGAAMECHPGDARRDQRVHQLRRRAAGTARRRRGSRHGNENRGHAWRRAALTRLSLVGGLATMDRRGILKSMLGAMAAAAGVVGLAPGFVPGAFHVPTLLA